MAPSPNTRRNIHRPPGDRARVAQDKGLFTHEGRAPSRNESWVSVEVIVDQDGLICRTVQEVLPSYQCVGR